MTPAKLALVDDDQQFVQYLDTLLRARGYDVHPFTSGSDLLQAMHAEAPPDVVLLDVSMPGMDGLETLKAVRVAHPNVQVIMLSGRQAPATIVDAMRQGAADYVVKPDDPDGVGEAALESAIRNAVEKTVLTSEVARLRTQIGDDPDSVTYWGPGPGMRQVLSMVDRVADSDVSVLLRGESGVGKEVVARELHRKSPRRAKPFVKVNAAALPSELLESELFGHERGAFTGAQNVRIGKFEFANHGTLMLDEIAEMPPGLQVPGSRSDDARRIVPRGPVLPSSGDRDFHSSTARAARRNQPVHRVLSCQIFRAVRPPTTKAVGRAARRAPQVRLAG